MFLAVHACAPATFGYPLPSGTVDFLEISGGSGHNFLSRIIGGSAHDLAVV